VDLKKENSASFKARVSQIISKQFSNTCSVCLSVGDVQMTQPVQLIFTQYSGIIQVAIALVL